MKLTLAEEITLLSLDDKTGQTICPYCTYALSAAILAELTLQGRIRLEQGKVQVRDKVTAGNDLLDEALGNIERSSGELSYLIRSPLAEHQRERVLQRLVAMDILERVEKKALGLFKYRRYPAHDQVIEAELRDRLRGAVLYDRDPDAPTKALLSVANAADMLETFLSRAEIQSSGERLRELTADDTLGKALYLAIRDDDAAIASAGITVAIT